MNAAAVPVVRGCGTRVSGGLYVETALSPFGIPVESFIICPPARLDLNELGITPLGVKLIERDGVFHVFDFVGSEHYPNPADFIEEVKHFGLSRRISKSIDLGKLTEASQIILIHARAYVENFSEYAARWILREQPDATNPVPRCPKGIRGHNQAAAPVMCSGVWWQDVTGGEAVGGELDPRLVTRKMPSFEYQALSKPVDVVPVYTAAAFASFPISRVVAVKGGREEDEANAKRLSRAKIQTDFVTE